MKLPSAQEASLKVFAGLIALSTIWDDDLQDSFDKSELKEKMPCSIDELAFAFHGLFQIIAEKSQDQISITE